MAMIPPKILHPPCESPLNLRCLGPEDGSKLIKLYRQVALETNHTTRHVDEVYTSPGEISKKLQILGQDPKSLWLGAFDHDQLVGLAAFNLPFSNHPWYQHLGSFGMMVVKNWWGQGIGRSMLMMIEEFAQKIGISKMEAIVRSPNTRAYQLYINMGYAVEGTRKRAAYIEGEWIDELYLAKFI